MNVVERAWQNMPSARSAWNGTKNAFNNVAKTAPEFTQWMSLAVVSLATYGFLNQFRKSSGADQGGAKRWATLAAIMVVAGLAGYGTMTSVHNHSNNLRREERDQLAAQRAQRTGLSGTFDGARDRGGWEPASPRPEEGGWEPAAPRSEGGWEPADPRREAEVAVKPSGPDPFRV